MEASPSYDAAARARRVRLQRARQGLNSGLTPAAAAAEAPAACNYPSAGLFRKANMCGIPVGLEKQILLHKL